MLEVRELQVFVAAAETGSFSEAARRMGLSQPAISFRIQSLEKKLKAHLFERVGKRVVLTEAGRELREMARELIALSTNIEGSMDVRRELKGHLQIGCGTSLAGYVLPVLLGAFRQHYPLVHVSCEGMTPDTTTEQLLKQGIHLGIVGEKPKHPDLSHHLLLEDEWILVVGAEHPWATRGKIAASELRQATWIWGNVDDERSRQIESGFADCGVRPMELRVAMELSDEETIQAAVEAKQGVAFVSRLAARRTLEVGRIKMIQVAGLTPVRREVWLIQSRSRASILAGRFQKFVDSPEGQDLIARHTSAGRER
ncbi:MAG: LysR family transcriptional regulator [Chloroflexi bacterium]|nr:LysR family transcriptional regulator [Chloroflexota bacterium]